ncbi:MULTISPECIES: cupin domain-containing protein [Vibrionaceae]|uniref:cupin domain-containing protein n=1 Tax=Vibrionaceae TaxID=641 RepID=UPI0006146F97|nr:MULTISPECIES: cupin domain-containing protein [Vibrionaceae]KKA44671.1 hypothetical protein WN56_09030 [Salinivibrio sp. KP-1]PAS27927.1 hypothetical protein CGT71_16950 [Vibrio cholerae]TXX59561.1 hypothetical protein FXF06_01710 [Vibrio cholerae]GIB59863.1 hypothetical protein VCSRO140_3221 [Vibrio cholerae]HAS3594573.1 hypothetical protein [Vibrio cholerae]
MEMKEFYYENGIRVSLFNLDHKAVPFHFHQTVSDMIYCSKGSIKIELPEIGGLYKVATGNVFQIPPRVKHRFANGEENGQASRYVLLQLGCFDIEFLDDTSSLQDMLKETELKLDSSTPVYIENRKDEILTLANKFSRNKPDVLTNEENNDVVEALKLFASEGITSPYPDKRAVIA